jgi:hypothetical protein
VAPSDLITKCLATPGVAQGYLRYNYSAQTIVIPNIVTLAGVLDAVPLEVGSRFATAPLVFDAIETFKGFGAREVGIELVT